MEKTSRQLDTLHKLNQQRQFPRELTLFVPYGDELVFPKGQIVVEMYLDDDDLQVIAQLDARELAELGALIVEGDYDQLEQHGAGEPVSPVDYDPQDRDFSMPVLQLPD